MRALVAGGAGFVGSHLCERLLADGWDVTAADSFITGREENLEGPGRNDRFRFVRADVSDGTAAFDELSPDVVFHLASPASPPDYLRYPVETLRVGALGTLNLLAFAEAKGARLLLASTSEVYGDPLVHPQPETYWGNVNPIGPRAVYDGAKRFAEAAAMAFRRTRGVDVKIARIFNTYGPRMRRDDGRAVPNFVGQALRGEPVTVHGDGSQTRSLCFVSDLVDGLIRLAVSDADNPVNIGNPEEWKILELARLVVTLVGSSSEIRFVERPADDPTVRCPDIARARTLGWEPRVSVTDGLERTIDWARDRWN
jgi:dTDP-glucose 4,6-dehydratase